jgi:hypothetical protein
MSLEKDEFAAVLEKFLGKGAAFDPANMDAFTKSIKRSTDELKKSQGFNSAMKDILNGQMKSQVDVTSELDELSKAIKKAKDDGLILNQAQLEETKAKLESTASSRQVKIGLSNFAVGLGTVASTMITGAQDLVTGLLADQSGISIGAKAATNAIKTAGAASNVFAQGLGSVAPLFAFLGPWGVTAAVGLTAVSEVLKFFVKKTTDAAIWATETLAGEAEKTQKAFRDISSAGAVLAGGMTQLRNQAFGTAMIGSVEAWSRVIKSSHEDLANMGIGLGEASDRVAKASGALRKLDEHGRAAGDQLTLLGYTFEEQAGLSASYMAGLHLAGDTRIKTEQEITHGTIEYGKSLKIISDATGKDAKKLVDKARLEAQQADIRAQLMKGPNGADQVAKFVNQMATMPDELKKGYMEFISSGGTAITDITTNIAMDANKMIMPQYQAQRDAIYNSNIKLNEATEASKQASVLTSKYAVDHNEAVQDMTTGARLGHNQTLQSFADFNTGLMMYNNTTTEASNKNAKAAVAAAAANKAPMDNAVLLLDNTVNDLKNILGGKLTDTLTTFATTSLRVLETVDAALDRMGIDVEQRAANKPRTMKESLARTGGTEQVAAQAAFDAWKAKKAGGQLAANERTHNLLNISHVAGTPGRTEGIQGQSSHATFDTDEEGIRAAQRQFGVLKAGTGHLKTKINTISGLINNWATTASSEAKANYANTIGKETGHGANESVDITDPKIEAAVMKAMMRFEGGSKEWHEKMDKLIDLMIVSNDHAEDTNGHLKHVVGNTQ